MSLECVLGVGNVRPDPRSGGVQQPLFNLSLVCVLGGGNVRLDPRSGGVQQPLVKQQQQHHPPPSSPTRSTLLYCRSFILKKLQERVGLFFTLM